MTVTSPALTYAALQANGFNPTTGVGPVTPTVLNAGADVQLDSACPAPVTDAHFTTESPAVAPYQTGVVTGADIP